MERVLECIGGAAYAWSPRTLLPAPLRLDCRRRLSDRPSSEHSSALPANEPESSLNTTLAIRLSKRMQWR